MPLHFKPDTLMAMKERDLEAKPVGDRHKYRALRNRVVKLLRRDKLDSNQELLTKYRMDPKKVWLLANSALGRGKGGSLPSSLDGVSGSAKVAVHVNKYYIDKISKLRTNFDGNRTRSGAGRRCDVGVEEEVEEEELLQLRPPTEAEVAKEIMGLMNTVAEGADCIPVSVIKKGVGVLVVPMAHMIAVSISTTKVPDGFKLASITPVHKRKKPADKAASYRPVAILPALSKVLERVIHKQLLQFMKRKFPNCQYGFRPKRNTVGAIVASHGSWAGARSAGEVNGVAMYDHSSAFDKLDHDKLLAKMHILGIRGRANSWFEHYLRGRSQRIIYNGHPSNYLPIRYGVPQGSILGPLLVLCLLVYLPDVSSSSRICSPSVGSSGYADDCIAWASAKDAATVKANLESISSSISAYMTNYCLVLNLEKTQILGVGGASSPVLVGNYLVHPSNVVDVFGVSLLPRTWRLHLPLPVL